MPDDKPKSNTDIIKEAFKNEIAEEMAQASPNFGRIQILASNAEHVNMLVGRRSRRHRGFVTAEDLPEDDDTDGPSLADIPRMQPFPTLTTPSLPPDLQKLIDKVIDISPFQADKAKKMLECAAILTNCAVTFEPKEKADSVFEFAQKLREKAMDILRPEFGDLPEEIKPAIRKLDLEDEVDAEFEAK